LKYLRHSKTDGKNITYEEEKGNRMELGTTI
jgi:hypothetical protein